MSLPEIPARQARRVFLALQALAEPPARSSVAAVQAMVERLGYVQIDSINVLDRAHHLILSTRLDGFRPTHLRDNLEKRRTLFEHWTHDACAIPSRWFPYWHHRFKRYGVTDARRAWWRERFQNDPESVLRRTLARVKREGPLKARDFAPRLVDAATDRAKGWWEWHPEKAALEHLWRIGRLAIARRDGFEKVYELSTRVHADLQQAPSPNTSAHDDWACREAIARLGIATEREIASFFNAVKAPAAKAWCDAAVKRGDLVRVKVASEIEGKPTACVALPDWKRLATEPDTERIVALCPFDPLVRERDRAARLFGFDYRFEAFTPAAKRVFGYYVLPLLEGDRLIGRIDPKFDRAAGVLLVRGPWWEPGIRADQRRTRRLHAALERLAANVSATAWRIEASPRG